MRRPFTGIQQKCTRQGIAALSSMEKFFSWKILVSFCAVFIVTWIMLQTVISMRLQEEAELIGSNIFSWQWPDTSWASSGEMTEAQIVHKGDNDAVIKVSGKQKISTSSSGPVLDNSAAQSETVDCSAVLTLYRDHDRWLLGRVEL